MTPGELKKIRKSFGLTQKQMAAVLGIHPNALQNFEYGKNPIPKYIRHHVIGLTALNKNELFKKHIAMIKAKL